eukprot:scaffold12476_cov64-Attheya_sp.AAC.5
MTPLLEVSFKPGPGATPMLTIMPGRKESVVKGTDDIHIVYDGPGSGLLKESIWIPYFILPSIDTHLQAVGPGTFMADVDMWEFFFNFMLHYKYDFNGARNLDFALRGKPYFYEDDVVVSSQDITMQTIFTII